PGNPRLARLLARKLGRRAQGHERPLPQTPLAGGAVDREAQSQDQERVRRGEGLRKERFAQSSQRTQRKFGAAKPHFESLRAPLLCGLCAKPQPKNLIFARRRGKAIPCLHESTSDRRTP